MLAPQLHSHHLVLESPGGVLIDVDFARQLRRRGALLALGEQIDGQKKVSQRQLGAVENRSRGERGLMVAFVAFEYVALFYPTTGSVYVVLTYIDSVSVQSVQRLAELLLATIVFEKFFQTDTYLELNRIPCHIGSLCIFRQFQYSRSIGYTC